MLAIKTSTLDLDKFSSLFVIVYLKIKYDSDTKKEMMKFKS